MAVKALNKIQAVAVKSEGAFIAVFVIAIYLSTSLSVVLSGLLGLLWLVSKRFTSLTEVLNKYPVALWALFLYGCFLVGLSYGDASSKDAFFMINKYRVLYFIPILISFLITKHYRYLAWNCFIVASVATLLISYLMNFGIVEPNDIGDPCLKSRITHSIFIAFFAFFSMHKYYDDKNNKKLYLILFMLCLHNIFFVVEGRTGQVIMVALLLLFAIQRYSVKEGLFAVCAVVIFLMLFLSFSDKSDRIIEGIANTKAYFQPIPEQTESSMGQRYTFWAYSLKLIKEKPLLGHGTGNFAKEYQRISVGEPFITKNPHNEFLMVAVQLGLYGLLVYLGFLISLFYYARKLPDNEKKMAQGLLAVLVIASLFNTPLFDHTEGHWFAYMVALCFSALELGESNA
ncbi:MAG: O-antigen ligase family protein [Methylobacter sp.]|nr:O-antigen ligase family protein [Methylobacter sp.]MDP2097302.1 O-antigen ligase family protein [Methylobacter sp.]MDP2428364.1 O-antigen ligase family protein [Methylobacter sp.]MDP3053207.1 O-antigen ligase family protein [Methylobacter sp.]MDP3361149.1 O-antigen ligase family protein [Methylobacter sp.]